MSADADILFKPAFELRGLIRDKRLSPVELVEASFRRIESLNPRLNAFLSVAAELAMDAARDAEAAVVRGDPLGPLHGIPVSIKDLEPAKGIRCTRGSLIFKEWVADRDEIAVERLKQAGAIVVGKTNTPEFGRLGTTENRLGDDCRNPWDPSTTTGGSSGGAAASVAAGMVPIAQGSDGGGSIRIPSSFCGIFGIKATQGRVPRRSQGLASWHPVNFSCVGPMTHTVRDAAIMLRVMAGPAPDAEHTTLAEPPPDFEAALTEASMSVPLKGLSVAVSPQLAGAGVDPSVVERIEESATVIAGLGAAVERLSDDAVGLDTGIDFLWRTYYTITAAKTASAFGRLMDEKGDQLTDYVKGDIISGRRVSIEQYQRELCNLERLRATVATLLNRFDCLLTPTTAVAAFRHRANPGVIGGRHVDRRWGFYPFTFPFNMAGNPAASIPCGFTADGRPIGIQVVGRRGDEITVLRIAAAFEAARPWSTRRPAVS